MRYQQAVFDNMMLGLRLGDRPRVLIATTAGGDGRYPDHKRLDLRQWSDLQARNAGHLSPAFLKQGQGALRRHATRGKVTSETPVFATVDGEIKSPRSISKAWKRMTRRLGITANFHATRHHHASRLIADGIDVVTVSRR